MDIKRYYVADMSFIFSKCNICVCRPFEQGERLFIDIWHPESRRYFGQIALTHAKSSFFSNICANFYTLDEAFEAISAHKPIRPDGKKFMAYKILRHGPNNYVLGVLKIPISAKIVSPYLSNKYRTDQAIVSDIVRIIPYRKSFRLDMSGCIDFGYSAFSPCHDIRYTVGAKVEADYLDEDRTMVATHGIHFYLTSEEALSSLALAEH